MARHGRTGSTGPFPDGLEMSSFTGVHQRMPNFGSRGEVSTQMATLRGAVSRSTPLIHRLGRPKSHSERLVDLLLDEDDAGFEDEVLELAAVGGDPQSVASDVLSPAARLIGDYWRMDICDFMKVTVAMSRIQRLFHRIACLYPPMVPVRGERTALLVPLPGEQHSFGLSIVDDALRRAGWQVDCCGVEEEEAYFELLRSNHYAVVGVSLSGGALFRDLAGFISKSKRKSRNNAVKVIVGGNIFVEKPGLAKDAGSDFLATSAASTIHVAEAAAWQQRAS